MNRNGYNNNRFTLSDNPQIELVSDMLLYADLQTIGDPPDLIIVHGKPL